MATVDLPIDNSAPKSLTQARSSAPHVIAITSGKGGVGKSSISVNLGLTLSRMGRKVCLFDADKGLANINILLGLTPTLVMTPWALSAPPNGQSLWLPPSQHHLPTHFP